MRDTAQPMTRINTLRIPHTNAQKGVGYMTDNNHAAPKTKKKPPIKPSDIKGKIEVPDTRERRDGPGGN